VTGKLRGKLRLDAEAFNQVDAVVCGLMCDMPDTTLDWVADRWIERNVCSSRAFAIFSIAGQRPSAVIPVSLAPARVSARVASLRYYYYVGSFLDQS
jgi:hypothetical protein